MVAPGPGTRPADEVSFAAAHVGDGAFAVVYSARVSQIRYENYLDRVPFVPPDLEHRGLLAREPHLKKLFSEIETWDYEPVGTLR